MADILIRGVEMPRSCMDCRLNYGEKRPEYCLTIVCKYSNGVVIPKVTGIVGRLPACGILELPEHGDLIDRDAFRAENEYYMNREFINPKYEGTLDDLLKDAPVVIPSNKEV